VIEQLDLLNEIFGGEDAAERKRRAESLAKPANTAEKAVGN
jgi:hypothetical protein